MSGDAGAAVEVRVLQRGPTCHVYVTRPHTVVATQPPQESFLSHVRLALNFAGLQLALWDDERHHLRGDPPAQDQGATAAEVRLLPLPNFRHSLENRAQPILDCDGIAVATGALAMLHPSWCASRCSDTSVTPSASEIHSGVRGEVTHAPGCHLYIEAG
jgi:hypothetical protein